MSVTYGLTTAGSSTDSGDSNFLNGTKITTTAAGTLISISAFIGATIGTTPNNQFQVAIYADSSGLPGSLIASSSSGTLTASAWNTASVSATLAASTSYWLMYNTNGTASNQNNMKYNTSGPSRGSNTSQSFGTWANPFPTGVTENVTFSIYASVDPLFQAWQSTFLVL